MVAEPGGRDEPDHLVVGHIAKAHGTKGEVYVAPLTDRADELFVAGRELKLADTDGVLDTAAGSVTIEMARPFKRGLLVKFAAHDTRADADELGRRYLLVPLEDVPPLEEGEVFYHQLLGMAVVTETGTDVGQVREVYETEPHHLLEVEDAAGKRHLVPFADRIVRHVDVDGGRIVIDPPEGLLDL